jgi:hypothetical protein
MTDWTTCRCFSPLRPTGLTGEIVRSVVQYLDGKTDKDMRSPAPF